MFIVYLIAEGGLVILLVLLLGKWVFILRNTLGALWDAVVWDAIVICVCFLDLLWLLLENITSFSFELIN